MKGKEDNKKTVREGEWFEKMVMHAYIHQRCVEGLLYVSTRGWLPEEIGKVGQYFLSINLCFIREAHKVGSTEACEARRAFTDENKLEVDREGTKTIWVDMERNRRFQAGERLVRISMIYFCLNKD